MVDETFSLFFATVPPKEKLVKTVKLKQKCERMCLRKFLVEDEVQGTMTYRYRVTAKSEEEALEKFKNDEWDEEVGSQFDPDSHQSGRIIVKICPKR